jgi:hypothetical protein
VKTLPLLFLLVPAVAEAADTAFVATTDFSSARSRRSSRPPRTAVIDRAAICSDAVLRYAFGTLCSVERFGCDNIRAFDPVTLGPLGQFSVGNGSNPNDICVFRPGKAYVARYDTPDIWVVSPTGFYFRDISLAAFADHDGLPEMNRMVEHAGRVFVSCQRLDRDNFFSPTDSSLVVVINTATDEPVDADPVAPGVQGILLPRTNPTTEFATTPEVGLHLQRPAPELEVLAGAVVRLDPRTLQVSVEVTEAELGGDINDVAVGTGPSGATRAFCVISDASFNTRLVSYERTGPPQVTTVHQGTGFVLADAEVDDRDEVWLCDRTASAPARIFDAVTRPSCRLPDRHRPAAERHLLRFDRAGRHAAGRDAARGDHDRGRRPEPGSRSVDDPVRARAAGDRRDRDRRRGGPDRPAGAVRGAGNGDLGLGRAGRGGTYGPGRRLPGAGEARRAAGNRDGTAGPGPPIIGERSRASDCRSREPS